MGLSWCHGWVQRRPDDGVGRRACAIVWRLMAHVSSSRVPPEMPRVHHDLVVMVVGGMMLRHGVVRVGGGLLV